MGSSKNAWLATGLFNFQQWPIPCMHACLTHPHQTRLVYRSLKIQNNALLFLEIQLTPSYITVSSRMKYAKRHQHLYFFHKECSFSIQILFQKQYIILTCNEIHLIKVTLSTKKVLIGKHIESIKYLVDIIFLVSMHMYSLRIQKTK